jgi:hypothetical protein
MLWARKWHIIISIQGITFDDVIYRLSNLILHFPLKLDSIGN